MLCLQVFHCVHFECPASSSALDEVKRVRRSTVGTFTPYYAAPDRHEDAIDASSDPEDEAGARGFNMASAAAANSFHDISAPGNFLLVNNLRAEPAGPSAFSVPAPGAAVVDRGDGFGFELAENHEPAEAQGGCAGARDEGSNHGDGREHSD